MQKNNAPSMGEGFEREWFSIRHPYSQALSRSGEWDYGFYID